MSETSDSTPTFGEPAPRPKSKRLRIALTFAAAAAALAGIFLLARGARAADPAQEARTPGAQRKAPPVTVVAAPATKGDIGDSVPALGTVAALQNVTVRTRIDGQLERVSYVEGQFVRAGQELALIDPRPYQVALAQAEGQLARDQALLQNALVDLERYRPMAAKKAIPEQQLAAQEALVAQYRGTTAADKASVDSARLQLSYCTITAPISGRVGLRPVDAGNMVHAADAGGVAVITQVDPIAVVFNLPEDSLRPVLERVRSGAVLPVEARDRADEKVLARGRVATVDNQIDATSGTVKVKAQFANADDALFPNQFVNVHVLVNTVRDAVLLPAAAIQRNGTDAFVYVVGDDGRAQRRPVQLGVAEATRVEAVSGVKAGETVVVEGFDKLQDGSSVVVSSAQGGGRKGRRP
ncbi:MAG: efflux RND transporter periplasmic adaptor subunit [Candidatus Polarisedimenticolia bacterium]|nr:efflux RND transporter periplasmic adaptor subunit [bacterium]